MNLILKNVRGKCYHRTVSMAGITSDVSKKKGKIANEKCFV